MKFSSKEDIAAPIEQVFMALTDFETFERAAMRRGIEVMRSDGPGTGGVGTEWQCRVPYRGKTRKLSTRIDRFDTPEHLVLGWVIMGLSGQMDIELVQLSPRQTRMSIALEMKPNSLTARLFIQSLRLAKASLNRKFKRGVARFSEDLEARLGAA
ncbi:SRPBCC family protein [Actibacterium sp. XHP0104]|uniref:SRPBCC family protein n=1 Tax=Actibacterium sp. XHP0104 TaxID=2984335 RepID=UPI0021E74AB6|nr:SRPBCC family protein [Actibacterium sp. XHP0104]MCV2882830.1 SRPBCC family protein [Actibacterium sp. XHP0104]